MQNAENAENKEVKISIKISTLCATDSTERIDERWKQIEMGKGRWG